MKITVLSLLFASVVASVCLAKRKQQSYPELQNVRKVYLFDPHEFGYLAPRHIKGGLRKSKCMELMGDPMKADAIVMPVMYKSWLDKFGEGLAGFCVSSNGTLLCNGGDKTEAVHCDSTGCMAGSLSNGGNESW